MNETNKLDGNAFQTNFLASKKLLRWRICQAPETDKRSCELQVLIIKRDGIGNGPAWRRNGTVIESKIGVIILTDWILVKQVFFGFTSTINL